MSHRLGQLNCTFAAEFELKDMKESIHLFSLVEKDTSTL
jgi:hypothetical protein